MTKLGLMPFAAILIAAAAVRPTVEPPVTGSMYNGNNTQAPKLTDPAELGPLLHTNRDVGGDQATPGGGRGAAQGGAG